MIEIFFIETLRLNFNNQLWSKIFCFYFLCTDEPKPKKRKSVHKTEQTGGQTDEQTNSVEDDVIVYGTELNIYDKREKCLLKSGSYDLILQELGSKFPTKNNGVWETAGGGKVSPGLGTSIPPSFFYLISMKLIYMYRVYCRFHESLGWFWKGARSSHFAHNPISFNAAVSIGSHRLMIGKCLWPA